MSEDPLNILNTSVTASVTRVTEYGVYLEHQSTEIIVLIIDVSDERIRRLADLFAVGDKVSVYISEYIPQTKQYKGTMKGSKKDDNVSK